MPYTVRRVHGLFLCVKVLWMFPSIFHTKLHACKYWSVDVAFNLLILLINFGITFIWLMSPFLSVLTYAFEFLTCLAGISASVNSSWQSSQFQFFSQWMYSPKNPLGLLFFFFLGSLVSSWDNLNCWTRC